MTQLDIHPEHLIDRVLRGTASEAERGELSAHLRVCSACAMERELALALREPLAGALETTSAAVDAAMAELIGTGRLLPAPMPMPMPANPNRSAAGHARAWLPWAVAACLFFTGSAAAATLIMAVRSSGSPNEAVSGSANASANAARRVTRKRAPTERVAVAAEAVPDQVPPVVATEPALLPSLSNAANVPNAQPSSQARVRRTPSGPSAPQVAPLGADELFANARAAAMRGEFSESAALYATLQKRFASSPQAHVSRVVLGRLYLEHLTDPRAALQQFDAYLKQGGSNRPEALLGRARALRALGRVQDEVETLRTLVDAYPESLYVAPAEERLRAVK